MIPLVGAILLFGDSLFGGKVFAPGDVSLTVVPFAPVRPPGWVAPANPGVSDPVYLFEPMLLFAREAIRAGHLPLWNPSTALGRPLGAQQGAPLFPTNWLAYVLPFWRSLAWIALAKLLAAFAGTFALARHHGTSRIAAAFAATAFAFSSVVAASLSSSTTNVVAVLPWALLAADMVVGGRWPRACVMGLAVGVAAFGGHPETWFVLVCGVAAIMLARLLQRRGEGVARPLLLIVLGGTVAGLVGSLYAVPFAELLAHSTHASRNVAQPDSLRQLVVGLLLPEWWGRTDKTVYEAHVNLAVASSVFPGRVYVGVAPLLAAVSAFALPMRRVQRFYLGLGAVSLALMIGLPGVRQLASHVPPLSLIDPHYFIWLLALCLAMLGGLGLDALIRAPPAARYRALALAGGVVVAVTLFVLITNTGLIGSLPRAVSQLPSQGRAPGEELARAGAVLRWILLCAIALLVVWIAARAPLRAGSAVGALLALAVADVLTIDAGYNPSLRPGLAHPPAPPAFVAAAADGPGRIVGPYDSAPPFVAGLYGLSDVRVEDLPPIARYTDTFDALGGHTSLGLGESYVGTVSSLGEAGPVTPGARIDTLLDLLGARYVIDGGGTRPSAPGVSVAGAGPGWRLLDNSGAFPRAWVAYDWRPAPSLGADLQTVRNSSTAQLRADPAVETAQTPPAAAAPAIDSATVGSAGDDSLVIRASPRRAGYLIVDDLFYPGWSATIDGRAAAILPADGMLRAVRLAPGRHTVRLSYQPESVEIGEILTVLGLLAGAIGAAVCVRQRWPTAARGRARMTR